MIFSHGLIVVLAVVLLLALIAVRTPIFIALSVSGITGLLFLSATGITWSTYAGAHVSDIRAAFDWQRPVLSSATTTMLTASPASLRRSRVSTAGRRSRRASISQSASTRYLTVW